MEAEMRPKAREHETSNRNWMTQGMRSPLKPLEEMPPCQHRDCVLPACTSRREEFLFFSGHQACDNLLEQPQGTTKISDSYLAICSSIIATSV